MEDVSKKRRDVCIKEINSNAGRMRVLIDDMLKLSKLDADMDNEEMSVTDLKALCREVVKEVKGVAEPKGVELSLTGGASLICRPKMMTTLVTNLVNNAIKYNKEGGDIACREQRRSYFESKGQRHRHCQRASKQAF